MPIEIRRIDYNDPRAVAIREAMDVEMSARYSDIDRGLGGDELDSMLARIDAALVVHPEEMIATVGAFDGEDLVGHAALRPFEDKLEVKRVIVFQEYRGQGISKRLMAELETVARERGVSELVLQTGDRQPDAVAVYTSIGYVPIPLFGLYQGVSFFLCFGKSLG
ncbi:MAG TPA: GNAT family N-acetyltransferase [Galbitalea sp.]|nr:GNAT family N-acetyltransferase [Galbitalea sp.]